jgi:L-iditol 2-dehydrogenase
MKAVIKPDEEPRSLLIGDVENPGIGVNDVLIRVKAGSICGSDLSVYLMKAGFKGYAKVPLVMGHEVSGIIEDVGGNVKNLGRGDRVISESLIYCGECFYCRSGMTNICLNFKVLGVHRNGGFAEYLAVNSRHIHKVPDEISIHEAALLEPTAVSVHAVIDRARIKPEDFVVVTGPGPIGLISAQIAKAIGANVIVTGPETSIGRLEIARSLGLEAVNVNEENPVERVLKETGGIGADVVIECSGSVKAASEAYDMLKKNGQLVVVAIFPEPGQVNYTQIVRREVRIKGSFCHKWIDYEVGINLVKSGKVRLKPIITHQFPIDEAKEAFETALIRNPNVKVGKVQILI